MSNSCIDFPVSSTPVGGMRFGFPGEDDTGGEDRLFTSAFSVGISTPLFSAGDLAGAGNGTKLIIDDANQLTTIGDTLGNTLLLDRLIGLYQIGDIGGGGLGTRFQIEDNNQLVRVIDSLGDTLSLDRVNGRYQIGDVNTAVNGTRIDIDDAIQLTTISDTIGKGLSIDFANTRYQMGDIDTANNGLHIDLDDGGQSTEIADNDGQMFLLNRGIGLYQMGDIGAALNNSFIRINDTTQETDILINGNRYLSFTLIEQRIGSVDGQGNQTEILIDDGNQEVQVNAANGIKINGDTILLHSTVALADGTGVATGTLTNAPTAGNPTKWISIEDTFGVIRYIPTWL